MEVINIHITCPKGVWKYPVRWCSVLGKKRLNYCKRHLEDCNMKVIMKVVAGPSGCANQELLDSNSTSGTDCMPSASIMIKEEASPPSKRVRLNNEIDVRSSTEQDPENQFYL